MTGIDMEGAELEAVYWQPTMQLRWRRPRGCNDTEMVLEQLWERVTGERSWHLVETLLED